MSENDIYSPEDEGKSLQQLIRERLIGVDPDDQDLRLDDADWQKVVVALDAQDHGRLDIVTERLVDDFAAALKGKLLDAQIKHGRQRDWLPDDWEAECKAKLQGHVEKGDPLDVAAYAAFCWRRGWTTTPQ